MFGLGRRKKEPPPPGTGTGAGQADAGAAVSTPRPAAAPAPQPAQERPDFGDTELALPALQDFLGWLDGLPAPALIADARTRVRWANGAARSWWPAASRLPQPLAGLLGMEPEAVDAALWESGSTLRDWPMRPLGASDVTCRVAISPLPDSRRLVVFTPVQDLHQDAQRARALSERMEAVQGFGRLGTWELQLRTQEARWDRQVFRLWGMEPAEQPPSFQEGLAYVLEEDRAAMQRSFEHSFRNPGVYEERFRIRRPDGSIARLQSRWAVQAGRDGQPERALGVMLDDTHALNSGLSEQASQAQLSSIVELAGIGICTWELRDQRLYLNGPAWEILGLPPRPQGLSFEEGRALLAPEDLPAALERFRLTTQGGTTERFEERVRRADGSWRSVVARQSPAADAEGRVRAVVQVGLDVTDLRAAAVAKAQAEAAQHELRSKSQFLSRMSHELRTPLNAMLGFTRLMRADTEGAQREQQPERLRHIEHAGLHLLSLIDDILDLSVIEGGEMRMSLRSLALHEEAPQALALVQMLAQQHGVSLREGALPPVWAVADATRLRQVLLNLLSNAVKYNRPGGQVSLSTRVQRDADAEVAVLEVADTGRGMSAEQLRHLFEPFNRLGAENTTTEGRGIGMTITKGLVERMGGTLVARSVLGEGSCFEVRLPLGERPKAPAAEASTQGEPQPAAAAQPDAPGTRAGRVLYIEDNPVNVMIVQQLLQRRPQLSFASAEDGTRGIEAASNPDAAPDLILLDMELPDMDGMQVYARLRAQPATAGIPCIALSGHAANEQVQAALDAGFAGYLTKPVDFEAFEQALARWFGP